MGSTYSILYPKMDGFPVFLSFLGILITNRDLVILASNIFDTSGWASQRFMIFVFQKRGAAKATGFCAQTCSQKNGVVTHFLFCLFLQRKKWRDLR